MSSKTLLGASLILLLCACQSSQATPTLTPTAIPTTPPTPVVIWGDDSLSGLLTGLERQAERDHPELDLQVHTTGGIRAADQARRDPSIDLLFVSDTALITQLYPAQTAAWEMTFAGDQLGLAYAPTSLYQERISPSNWARLMAQPEARLGLPDPQSDPIGYRAIWALWLADDYYRDSRLYADFVRGRLAAPIAAAPTDTGTLLSFTPGLNPREGGGLLLRSAAGELLAMLAAGDLDYVFAYRSQAQQLSLNFLDLPRALNFGEALQAGSYRQVSAEIGGGFTPIQGDTINYSFTIPTGAPHPQAAAQVAAYLIGHEGRRLVQSYYLAILPRPLCVGKESMPPNLVAFCVP